MSLQRHITRVGLLFVSVGAMVGSGWLFGPLYAAQVAGPAATVTWAIGGLLVLIVALSFAELSAMLPIAGGIARFPQFTHGPLVSFIMSWIGWLALTMLPAIEVQALLQYASNYYPALIHSHGNEHALSLLGYFVAAGLLGSMAIFNLFGIRLVTKCNTGLVWLKLAVPAVTGIILISVSFSVGNFSNHGGFLPYGVKSVFEALPMAGVIFSFFGFRLAVEPAQETKNPQRTLPLALIGSIVICIVLYTLVQIAFVGAVPDRFLSHGWSALHYKGEAGPFAGIVAGLGLVGLLSILYIDAIISPFGSALVVVSASARSSYAMSVNGAIPAFFQKLNRYDVPHWSIAFNFIIGMLMLLPFPGWQKLAEFIVAALILAHIMAPISLMALRKQLPEQKRVFRLPYALGITSLGFIILNNITYWTGWYTISKMMLAILVGLLVFAVFRLRQPFMARQSLCLRQSVWVLPYFVGMTLFSYYGGFGGGKALIPFGWDSVFISLFSLIVFYCGVQSRQPAHSAQKAIEVELAKLPLEADTLV